MSKVFQLFLLACSICHCLCLKHANTPCTPTGLCRCIFPDNQGINANRINSQFVVNLTSSTQLIYNPCKDGIIKNDTDCSLAALCLVETVDGNLTYTNIGLTKGASLVWPRISDPPKFIYRGTPTQKKQTEIRLTCAVGEGDSVDLLNYDPIQEHILLELKSEFVCLQHVMAYGGGGPSPVSLIAIIILVLFLLYFIGGYLVLRFIRGAEGVEAIPNHEFWMSLPQKCRDGFLYLINGCQTPPSYDRI